MKKQDYISPYSNKLKEYLNNAKVLHFDEHGYDEMSIFYSKTNVNTQKRNKGEIWLNPQIGQPFLLWNKQNQIDISGVLNYNPKTQTGLFEHNTISGTLKIENVHSYFVFFNTQISDDQYKYMPAFSRFLPEYEESKDVYVAAISQNNDQSFTLKVYHNTKLIDEYADVYSELYFSYRETTVFKNRLSYFRFSKINNEKNYFNYIYDINNERKLDMDNSDDIPSFYIDYRKLNMDSNFNIFYSETISNFESKLKKNNDLSIIFHLDNSKTSAIISEFIRFADERKVLKNIFSDDDTENILVTYKNRPKDVRFLYYCFLQNEDLLGNSIFGCSINDLYIGTKNNVDEYKNIFKYSINTIEFYKSIVKELYKLCNEKENIGRLPKKIYENYIENHRMLSIIHKYCYAYDNIWATQPPRYKLPFQTFMMKGKSKIFEEEKIRYDEIYQKLAQKHKLPIRWKNEYTLYQLLIKEYPDAIYQYHSKWLGRQSLDIFIPSINTGFEYQGLQHYEPIEFFGGIDAFNHRIELDEKKRKLCKKNDVKLIEWKYNMPITKRVLQKYLTLNELI